MSKKLSISSIPSISSESLNINCGDSLPSLLSNKDESLQLCINEFNLINSSLEKKIQRLKNWEKELQCKETAIVNLCDSLDKYINCEVTAKTSKIVNETQEKVSELNTKYDSLHKDHKRLQFSFEKLKLQNKSLQLKLEQNLLNEEVMKKEKQTLLSKVTKLTSNNVKKVYIKYKNAAIQTVSSAEINQNHSFPQQEKQIDFVMSFTFLLRELWFQIFEKSMQDISVKFPDEVVHYSQSFADICLSVIPMCIEYLRINTFINSVPTTGICSRKKRTDVLIHYIEMLHWSLVYMDFTRTPLRQGMMSPLTRLGEDLAHIFIPNLISSSLIKIDFDGNDEFLILIILLTLRSVNQVDILSNVIRCLSDLVTKNPDFWGILLSKYLYVPLLCRWTSTSASYTALYPKILNILLESFHHERLYSSGRLSLSFINKNPKISIDTGLDNFIFIVTNMTLHVTETSKTTTSHPLVFLLDILCNSKPNEREIILKIMDQIIHNKDIRVLLKDLGIVGIISNLISQNAEPYDSQYSLCVPKLKSILTRFVN